MRISNQQLSFLGTRVNALYFNDSHGQTKYIDTFCDEQDKFYKSHPAELNVTLSGGDVFLDKNKKNETVAQRLLNRVDAIGVGNHDIEAGSYFNGLIEKFNLKNKFLSANMNYGENSSYDKNIAKSMVIDKSGDRIGVIGISPLDFNNLAFLNATSCNLKVQDFEQTKQSIKEEVKKLEDNKIDKIFLLAHTGEHSKNKEKYYEEFASIGGIDVIIGGHDHREVNKWAVSDRNEPVRIVATGKTSSHGFGENLDYIGELELDFDEKGVLNPINCKNNLIKLENKLGVNEKELVKVLPTPTKQGDVMKGHSEIANIVADSNLWYVNKHTKGKKADFAFVNAGTIRANFDDKNISKDDIEAVVPFVTSTLIKTSLNKKQVQETLNWCAKSTGFSRIAPGIMHVSSLEYDVNPDLSVDNIKLLNDDGSVKCRLDECSDDKEFTVVIDKFLATGTLGLVHLKKDCVNDSNVECFQASRQDALLGYLKQEDVLKDYKAERIHLKY